MAAKPIPDRFNSVSVYLVVPKAEEALPFYEKAFGAKTVFRMPGPGGQGTMHAEMQIGDSIVMLTDENPQWNKSPKTLGATPTSMFIYTEDVDALYKQAVDAGCEVQMPIEDMFWGDRYAKVQDPFGHEWAMATHKEDLSEEELAKRQEAMFAEMAKKGQDCPSS